MPASAAGAILTAPTIKPVIIAEITANFFMEKLLNYRIYQPQNTLHSFGTFLYNHVYSLNESEIECLPLFLILPNMMIPIITIITKVMITV